MFPFDKKKDHPQQPDSEPGAAPHADPDETAQAFDDLQKQIALLGDDRERLTKERGEAQNAHKHALADFQNYQRRAISNEQQAREQGVRGVVFSVMNVVDHFEMALSLDPARTTAQQVISGVSMIKDELLSVLANHGIALIKPAPGDDFDPTRHEAVMQQPSATIPPGHVVSLMRTGYALNDKVIRPAQVVVARDASPTTGTQD